MLCTRAWQVYVKAKGYVYNVKQFNVSRIDNGWIISCQSWQMANPCWKDQMIIAKLHKLVLTVQLVWTRFWKVVLGTVSLTTLNTWNLFENHYCVKLSGTVCMSSTKWTMTCTYWVCLSVVAQSSVQVELNTTANVFWLSSLICLLDSQFSAGPDHVFLKFGIARAEGHLHTTLFV